MKGKKIDLKDITNSPYFIAGLLVVVIVLVIVSIVFFANGITQTKDQIVEARKQYETNIREIAILEELRAQSKKAEQTLEEYKGILPDDLGDVYVLQENVISTCSSFGLKITSIEVTQSAAQTQETAFVFNAEGTFRQIYDYMNYMSNLKQIHRIDGISLTRRPDKSGMYMVTINLAILSQNGAQGIVGAVVDQAVAKVTE